MSQLSLRARLTVGFLLLTAICWGIASVSAWLQTRHKINQLFDTQQLLFARHLASLTPAQLTQSTAMPEAKKSCLITEARWRTMRWLLPFIPATAGDWWTMATTAKNFCLNRAGVAFVTANCATMTIRGA